jgi:coiled-coil domain-containing protein 55
MSKLSYGLNISAKKAPGASRPLPAKRKTIFDDDEDSEHEGNDNQGERVEQIGGLHEDSSGRPRNKNLDGSLNGPPSGGKAEPPSKKGPSTLYGSLSTAHSANKYSKTATELDPSIYDYDSFHTASTAARAKSPGAVDHKPKYMSNLLAAAEVRKRDQLRAKEKLLAKERELEGDEFADKEKFVTQAYKDQQKENARLEEEERQREEEAAKRKDKTGMLGFYKGILDKVEQRHEKVAKAAADAKPEDLEEAASKEKSAEELAREANAKGANVIVNDDGQIVDKRQLLSAGLNAGVNPRNGPLAPSSKFDGRGQDPRHSQRGRETRNMEEQLLQAMKRSVESDSEEDEGGRASKSRRLEDEILGKDR